MYEKITVANVNMFLIIYYDNSHCESQAEFNDDMKRFNYIKRFLRKYHETGVLKERLLLNHLIVIKNLFGPEAAVTLLLFKIQSEHWKALKSFLIFLNLIRSDELGDIEEDKHILEVLREL